MKKISLILTIIMFFLGACSFKSEPNQWQYKSSSAFKAYTQNFLSNKDKLAYNDLHRSKEHAKMSADLETLARIYLGVCALNISVGIQDPCEEYKEISPFVQTQDLDAYYKFISSSLKQEEIDLLSQPYKTFALYISQNRFKEAKEELFNIQKTTSLLLGASLIKENLTKKEKEKVLDVASFHGYKKAVLYWLKELQNSTNDLNEKAYFKKKIDILQSEN